MLRPLARVAPGLFSTETVLAKCFFLPLDIYFHLLHLQTKRRKQFQLLRILKLACEYLSRKGTALGENP